MFHEDHPPTGNLRTMKKAEIMWRPEAPQHICEDAEYAEEIVEVVKLIRSTRCTLDTLRLSFNF